MVRTPVGVTRPLGIKVEKTFSLNSNEVVVEERHGKRKNLTLTTGATFQTTKTGKDSCHSFSFSPVSVIVATAFFDVLSQFD